MADFGETARCSDPAGLTNELDSQLYTDLQFGWAPEDLFGGGWSFAVGVQNLTDESPPVCFSCDLNSLDGTIYPIAGQFWYLRATFTELTAASPSWRRKAPARGLFFARRRPRLGAPARAI